MSTRKMLDGRNITRGSRVATDQTPEKEKKPEITYNNNIKDIRSIRQLERVNLNFESPRMKRAMDDLGVSLDECEKKTRADFEKPGLDQDLVDLRFKHYQARLIDTFNQILEQRREIKIEEARNQIRNMGKVENTSQDQNLSNRSPSPVPPTMKPSSMNLPIPNAAKSPILKLGSSLGLNNLNVSSKLPPVALSQGAQNAFLEDMQINQKKRPFMEKKLSSMGAVFEKQARTASQGHNQKMESSLNVIAQQLRSPQATSMSMNFNNFNLINSEDIIQRERRKLIEKQSKAKQITMLKFAEEKNRKVAIQKSIDKKQRAADKARKQNLDNQSKKREKFFEKEQGTTMKIMENAKYSAGKEIDRIKCYEEEQREKEEVVRNLTQERKHLATRYLSQQKVQREKVQAKLQEQQKEDAENMNNSMHEIQQKLLDTSIIQREILEERATRAAEENRKFEMKVNRFKMQAEESKRKECSDFENAEIQKQKKLRVAYNSMNRMFKDFKEKRKEHWYNMSNRKADGSQRIEEQKIDMMERRERSQRAVQAYMDQKAHKNMLNSELAKLKAQDMQKVHTRAKRLETRKKGEIINKELQNKELVKKMRDQENQLIQLRYQNKVKHNVDKQLFSNSMDVWAISGYQRLPKAQGNLLQKIDEHISAKKTYIQSHREAAELVNTIQ